MDKLESIFDEISTETTESTSVETTTETETVEETITTDGTECVDNYTYNEETEECEYDGSIDEDEIEVSKDTDSKSRERKEGGGKKPARGAGGADGNSDSESEDSDDDQSSEFIELESSADYLSSYYETMNWYSEDSYLEAYGGQVESEIPEITIFGSFEIKFNRPIVFPESLVADYIPSYVQSIPDVITDKRRAEANSAYEEYEKVVTA